MSKSNGFFRSKHAMVALILGATFVSSAVVTASPTQVFAMSQNTIVANTLSESSGNLYTTQNYTKPDAPIVFTLNATPDVLQAMHLDNKNGSLSQQGQKSQVGVLITDGTHNYLATQDNGDLSYTLNGKTLTISANHSVLNRYTSYNAYLLVGKDLNKYESQANSNGNSKAFANVDKNSMDTVQFKTGSAIGEPTNWTSTVSSASPSVINGATITVQATDDYGNPATSGSVAVTGVATSDGTTISNTFSAPKSISLTNGKAVISITNHKAQAVNFTLQTSGKYANDSKSTSVSLSFQPGPAHSATMNSSESTVNAGSTDSISGQVTDLYGNPVNPTTMNLTASDGSVQSVTTGNDGKYSTTFTAPTKLNQSQSLSEGVGVSLKSAVGDASKSVQVTVNPDKPSTSDLLTSSVGAGTQTEITGDVKDQYGNLVLPTDVSANSSDGSVTSSTKTDDHGKFSLTFTAPKKLDQSQGVSEKVNMNLNFAGNSVKNTDSLAVNPDAPSQVVLNPVSNVTEGTPVQLTGSVTDQYGNEVADGTPVTLLNGSSTFATAQTKNGKFSYTFTPQANTDLSLSASAGSAQTTSPVKVSTVTNYSGSTTPTNVTTPTQMPSSGGQVSLKTNQAFTMPSLPYNASSYVPFYYWSQFPVVNPSNFTVSATTSPRGGANMWLNQYPYGGGGTPNGLVYFRTTFTLAQPADVKVSIPGVDDVALAYIDSNPVAYNNDINYTSGFRGKGISLPPSSQTIHLGAGTHAVILEVENAFTPGGGNWASVNFQATNMDNGQTLVSTANPSAWKSTGFVTKPPVSWYFNNGQYTVSEELLNFWSLSVGTSASWSLNVQ